MNLFRFILTIKCSLFIFVAISINASFASSLQAEFKLTEKNNLLKEGEIIEGTLRIWPLENPNLSELRDLQGKTLFGVLYLTEIVTLKTSENNADVTELHASFIVKGAPRLSDQPILIQGQNILIAAPLVKVEKLNKETGDYVVMNQAVGYSFLWWILISIGMITTGIVLFMKRGSIKLIIEKYKSDPITQKINYYSQLFSKAATRQDFELVYAERKNWLPLIKIITPAHQDFFKTIENHQYKKDWTKDDLTEVSTSFEMIRRSLQ